jgi:DNA mismatch repair protein MutS2
VLTQLAASRGELENRIEQLEAERARIEQDRSRLRERLDEVQQEADRLRREGAKAFEAELASARRVVAEAISRAQGGADARELNELSHGLREVEQDVAARAETPAAEPEEGVAPAEVSRGDKVRVVDMPGAIFDVVEVDGDEVVVANGPMRLRARRTSLRAANRGARRATKPTVKTAAVKTGSEPRTKDNTLDLRGERVGDAMDRLEAFLDRLLREGRGRGFVLHGHGTGALKRAVREALVESRYVRRSFPADPDDGGDACTELLLADAKL